MQFAISCDHDQVTITLAINSQRLMVTAHDMRDRIDRNVKQMIVPVAVLLSTLQLSRYHSRKNVCFAPVERLNVFVSRSFRSCSIAYLLCFVKRFVEQFLPVSENSCIVSIGLSRQVRDQKKEPTDPREVSTKCWEDPAR
jgi:hypothetical protein